MPASGTPKHLFEYLGRINRIGIDATRELSPWNDLDVFRVDQQGRGGVAKLEQGARLGLGQCGPID